MGFTRSIGIGDGGGTPDEAGLLAGLVSPGGRESGGLLAGGPRPRLSIPPISPVEGVGDRASLLLRREERRRNDFWLILSGRRGVEEEEEADRTPVMV